MEQIEIILPTLTVMKYKSADKYLDPYREAVKEHGAGFNATLWMSREAQVLRFDVMTKMAEFADSIILDAGCGSGDFAAHLIEKKIAITKYLGIDGVDEQIEKAKEREIQRSDFIKGDFVGDPAIFQSLSPDWICFSGSLNTLTEKKSKEILEHAFHAAAKGIVFNFLSDRAHKKNLDRDTKPARRFNTVKILDWALSLTVKVQFRQEYLDGHDATIAMEH